MMSRRERAEFRERTQGLVLAFNEFQSAFLHVLIEAHASRERLSLVEASRRTMFALKLKELSRVYVMRDTNELEKSGVIVKEKQFKPYTVYLLPGSEKEIAGFLEARRALTAKCLFERERQAVGGFINAKRAREHYDTLIQPAGKLITT